MKLLCLFEERKMMTGNNIKGMLYPTRSQWGTYRGCCSRRDGARTSVKTGSWAGCTHSH